MLELNLAAADVVRGFEPSAVTDVTGFGLLGHAHELASRSGVRAVLDSAALPALPGALELAQAGVRTGGDRRNREFAGTHVESSADEAAEALAFDPQTAGGLLVSVPAERAAVLEATFDGGRVCPRRGSAASSTAPGSFSASGRRHPTRAHGLGAHIPPDRGGVDLRPLPRHHVRRLRPAHRVGARLRELAALRRQALPRAGLSRLRRVRKPHGRARRHRAHARHPPRLAHGPTGCRAGDAGRRSGRFSSRSRRSRWAGSRSRSTSIRSR